MSHEPGRQIESIQYNEDPPKGLSSLSEPESLYRNIEETSSLLSKSSGSAPGDIPYPEENAKAGADHDSHQVDIRGLAMLSTVKFYQLWSMLGLLTGIGLMTIK